MPARRRADVSDRRSGVVFAHRIGERLRASLRPLRFSRISTFCCACLQCGLAWRVSATPRSKCLERFLERQVALFEPLDQRFELGQRLFEVRKFLWRAVCDFTARDV